MNIRLAKIQDWPELARQSKWSVAKMANQCGVSESTLRRQLSSHLGMCLRLWLIEQRFKLAIELREKGFSIKEISSNLGYCYPQNFTRDFKKHWGKCPSELLDQLSSIVIRCRLTENDMK